MGGFRVEHGGGGDDGGGCSGDGETQTEGEKRSLEATRTAISTSTENGDQPRSDAYIYTYLNE